jgi:tetratricopeptide (TPR) repeat protein
MIHNRRSGGPVGGQLSLVPCEWHHGVRLATPVEGTRVTGQSTRSKRSVFQVEARDMSRSRSGMSDPNPKRRTSGARGGPATGGGLNYQTNYGVLHSLYLISRALGDPFGSYRLHIEPRVISGVELTSWDLRIEPPDLQVEAKLNPSKEDALQFLERASRAHRAGGRAEYRLVHHHDVGHLAPLAKLIRLALEAQGDPNRLQWLLTFEGTDGAEEMLNRLGETAHEVLRRTSLEQLSQEALGRQIQQNAEMIAGPAGAQQLIHLLFHTISEAIQHRASFSAQELIQEARKAGIQLWPPPSVSPSDLAPLARSAIFAIQAVPDGLPPGVVAEAIGCPLTEMQAVLAPYLEQGCVVPADGLLRLSSATEPLIHPNSEDLVAHILQALLDLVQPDPTSPTSVAQVGNIVLLAKQCAVSRPKLVAKVFHVLQKTLKRFGDKRRILDVARLSIDAARGVGADRTDEYVGYEAQALICGVSWVYQRIGRLEDALAAAKKSLQLGEDIRWWRNTTFCRKCIGRLLRIHAEQCTDPQEKAKLLRESVNSLLEAIERFGSTEDGGPNDLEVGDCYSLLGRTYLVMRDLPKALQAVRQADNLLTNRSDKDYLDLLILWGEVMAARGDRAAAENLFCEALQVPAAGDAEQTEMRARAYFQRARNRQARRQPEGAVADYWQAAEIWRELGEQDRADEAEWQVVLLTEQRTPEFRELLRLLESERFGVRLGVLRQRKADLAQLPSSFRGRRSDAPGRKYWERLIAVARKDYARGNIDW